MGYGSEPMPSRRPIPGITSTGISVADDFSFQIWREVFSTIVSNEKRAMETGEAVSFALEVRQKLSKRGRSEVIVKIELVCEPGKPARLVD
jgi:hypothetical protein